jgi:sulfur oxidation c-type cytochrome SoxX
MQNLRLAQFFLVVFCAGSQLVWPDYAWAQQQAHSAVASGRALALNRQESLCVLCHRIPGGDVRQQGNLGPDLTGIGARLNTQELRDRLANPKRNNPDTIMPRTLNDTQIDQIVAFLETLK